MAIKLETALEALLISNATVISAITLETNWVDGDFVDPGGIIALCTERNYYTDLPNGVRYDFKNSIITRTQINTL